MKKLIVLFFIAYLPLAYAYVDYNCQSDCSDKGYSYAFCQSRCSYNGDSTNNAWRGPDLQCVNDCTKKGYMYQFCVEHCS